MNEKMNRIINSRNFAIYVSLLVLMAVITFFNPNFLTVDNLMNILRQMSVIGLLALGVTLVIITKGIDLSSGSVVALSAVVAASLAQAADASDKFYPGLGELPIIIPILAGVSIGLICGAINGGLIAYAKLPPFIATLGMMVIARGLALLYTNGRPIAELSDSFTHIGKGSVAGIPIPVIIFGVMAFITWVLLNYTKFGKSIYAIGANQEAARISGINVEWTLVKVYAYAGMLAGLGGVILAARVGSGQPNFGDMYELHAIAAATIGGASHAGGIGTIGGTIAGVLILGVISNGFTLLGINAYWQQIITGLIIIIAVAFDMRKHVMKK